jgi:hypothetical protein
MGSQNFDSNVLTVPAVKGVNTATPLGAPPECVGVAGQSDLGVAVAGTSISGFGVHGISQSNFGVRAVSISGVGLRATTDSGGTAIDGSASQSGSGVFGASKTGDGVLGISTSGVGVHGKGGQLAGFFEGDVRVTGLVDCPTSRINCLDMFIANGDCAEEFELTGPEQVDPGTLMSFRTDGTVAPSLGAYDNKVAGVISGAGEYKPGIVLDRRQGGNRVPIALMGKVYCKVDARYSAIEVGDLLTTSPTAGHAMKATDTLKAFGSVIGKALRSKSEGQGMIPVLVALQ